jgi:hypothetical protein
VIAYLVLIRVFPMEFLGGHLLDLGDGFQLGYAVLAASTNIIALAGPPKLSSHWIR